MRTHPPLFLSVQGQAHSQATESLLLLWRVTHHLSLQWQGAWERSLFWLCLSILNFLSHRLKQQRRQKPFVGAVRHCMLLMTVWAVSLFLCGVHSLITKGQFSYTASVNENQMIAFYFSSCQLSMDLFCRREPMHGQPGSKFTHILLKKEHFHRVRVRAIHIVLLYHTVSVLRIDSLHKHMTSFLQILV